MEWSKELETGIGLIDAEHIRIAEMVETLKAGGEDLSDGVVHFLFTNLARYTERHFIVEEEYMALYEYPDIKAHKKSHQVFFNKVLSLKKDLDAGGLKISPHILDYILTWLENHILHEDQKLAQFLQNLNVKEI